MKYIGFIVGYTSNGVPYGLPHNEMDEIKDEIIEAKNLDLPF